MGLKNPPVADLLSSRPRVADVRYAKTDAPGCEVGADLVIELESQAELDWLDIVLTRKLPNGGSELASEACAMVGYRVSSTRIELIPGQHYIATVAAYDVDGRKSEAVNLEVTGPGIGSREWMSKAPYCPQPWDAAVENALPKADLLPRKPWSRAVVGVVGGVAFLWVLWVLCRPRRQRDL